MYQDKILIMHKLYTLIDAFMSDPKLILTTTVLPKIGKTISDIRSDLIKIFKKRIDILNMTKTIQTSESNDKTKAEIEAYVNSLS